MAGNLPAGTTDAMIDRELEANEESYYGWDDECHKCGHLRTDHETTIDPESDGSVFDGPCQFCDCQMFV